MARGVKRSEADLPTADEVRAMLDYDPLTGLLRWKKDGRRAGYFNGDGSAQSYQHIRIVIGRQKYYAHRLAWLLSHGSWPAVHIDHINGDPSDNRLANLREAKHGENQWNRGKQRSNTSGYKGVFRHGKGWRAQIWVDYKGVCLGTYRTPEEAHAAYCRGAAELHREFANVGDVNAAA